MPLIGAKNKHARVLALMILTILLYALTSTVVYATSTMNVVIFADLECSRCEIYVNDLTDALNEMSITGIQVRDLGSDSNAQGDLDNLRQSLGVPENMRGILAVSFDDKFLFEGYVPVDIITDFLANHTHEYDTIVVYKDELGGKYAYKIRTEDGPITECGNIQHSIGECIESPSIPLSQMLLLIVGSGLLDGVNPCAFAVLFFFIALLLMHFKKTRRSILSVGAVYITAVFLAYLTIGLTIRKAIVITGAPHLVATVGALLVIVLGIINIKDYFWPGRGFSLGISQSQWDIMRRWMHKFTFPAAFAVGLMVGLFEFPCTGGIYVAIGILLTKMDFVQGFTFLLLYNLAFILPLIAILVFMFNKRVINFSLSKWQRHEKKTLKLLSGLFMVALGILLLFLQFT